MSKPIRLIIEKCKSPGNCPGDILMLTAAVRDLHRTHRGRFLTTIDTSQMDIWNNNPFNVALEGRTAARIECHYPLIRESNRAPYHFIHGFSKDLMTQLGVSFEMTEFKGDIYLSNKEINDPPIIKGDYWIMVAGGKYDFTAKWWNPKYWQDVVDYYKGKIQFVQVGKKEDFHQELDGVVNLVGKTTTREFFKLIYHSDGVICPVTFAMHAAAAVPIKVGKPATRPCVVIAGGREPMHWEAYPGHQYLHTIGQMDCCMTGGCWKSRCQLVEDGDVNKNNSRCSYPVAVNEKTVIPKCMVDITPDMVIQAINRYQLVS